MRGRWRAIRVLAACLLLSFAACDRTAELLDPTTGGTAAAGHAVATQLSGQSVLEQCGNAYQALDSYEDHAYVSLRYKIDGKLVEDKAPLSIAWDSRGNLGIQAYSVEAGPSDGRWHLRIKNDDSRVARQVLSRAVPQAVSFDWLLSDPIVSDRLSAGLAGFPPQLDLLLSDNPLHGLLDESSGIELLAPREIETQMCHRVLIRRGDTRYELWIDQASMLLRRLVLPESYLSPKMLEDNRVEHVALTIELTGVETNHKIDWQRFAVAAGADELRVSYFVPSPPEIDTLHLGKQIPGFVLRNPLGEKIFSSSADEKARKATVLVWLADHPACRVAVEQLSAVRERLEKAGLRSPEIDFFSVWAEPQPAAGTTFDSLPTSWKLPGRLALDQQAMGRDLFAIREAPTIVVLDQHNRLQWTQASINPMLEQILVAVLTRVADGEDIASETISYAARIRAHHAAQLRLAAAVDALSQPAVPQPYEPLGLQLEEVARHAYSKAMVSSCIDGQGKCWTLFRDGTLSRAHALDGQEQEYQSGWALGDATSGRLEVDTDGRFAAYCTSEGSTLHLFDIKHRTGRSVAMKESAEIIDFQWMQPTKPGRSHVLVITEDRQTFLLDPHGEQPLSGTTRTQPRAIVVSAGEGDTLEGSIVLADRTVEPIRIASEGSSRPKTATGSVDSPATPLLTARRDRSQQAHGSSDLTTPRQVGFQPARGPWRRWSPGEQDMILARGWLAQDEPALLMLDDQFNKLWHYRLPLEPSPIAPQLSMVTDPTTGQAVWATLSSGGIVHLLRADGLSDHMRPREAVTRVELSTVGGQLLMMLLQPQESITYRVHWR